MFSEIMMTEKKDACYYKVKASAKVWPSAYASGRLVQCRKKGAGNYGNKSVEEAFDLHANSTSNTNSSPELRGIHIPGNMKHPDWKEPTWNFQEIAQKLGVSTKELNGLVALYPGFPTKTPGIKSKYGSGAYYPRSEVKRWVNATDIRNIIKSKQGVAEDYNPEYDDEAGMADNNLETLERAVDGIDNLIQSGDNLPEWCQEKIAVAKSMLVAVWDYMYSEESSDEVDPEVDEMFEAMTQLVAEMAQKNRVSEDLVWETFEAMPDNVLYETAAWRRSAGKSKKGGLNAKGVASYRRENPGSKLQMAVTTKPSKLKPGSKAAKRRKSFCARMGGVKGPMKKPNGKPTRKALALRKWNC
jgi:hypothetical protein